MGRDIRLDAYRRRTCEVVVEEALKAEAKETGGEWLSHQETFRRYVPNGGFYERVSH